MKVALINYTGMGMPSPSDWAARHLCYIKNTRLTQGQETREMIAGWPADKLAGELDYIAKTIRSSWEFIDYTFEITDVTRAFTHQLVRTRTASYAQQAQRVVDMGHFGYLLPATVTEARREGIWNAVMANIAAAYRELQGAGVPNQDCRGLIPTNAYTNIITKMNLRTIADLVGKRENLRAQGEYADVVREMKRLALGVHPWIAPYLNPERSKTPALDQILAKELGNAGPLDKPHVNEALKELDALKGVWG